MKRLNTEPFQNMLVTDLDGTLVGDDNACRELITWMENSLEHLCLVYITGRHYYSAKDLILAKNLPQPNLLVTDVGTEIHLNGKKDLDYVWQDKMGKDWRPDCIREIAVKIDGLVPQDLPVNCRLSYYVRDASIAEEFERALSEAGIRHFFIFSSDRDVDILPAGSGKGEALKYIANIYAATGANIMVAGDSGNDEAMLTAGYPGVIVGNAQPELDKIPSSPLVYRAKAAFAAGIMEGWFHFFK